MARDTRGPFPPETAGLYRVSLNPEHWHQVRPLLAAEAAVTGLLGAIGLLGIVIRGASHELRPVGLPLTPALCIGLLALALAAAGAAMSRSAAKIFLAVATVAALALVIGSGVTAAHQRPGPLGLTPAAIVWWAIVFCYNLGLGIWVIPDHLEGRAWVWKRRSPAPEVSEDRCDGR